MPDITRRSFLATTLGLSAICVMSGVTPSFAASNREQRTINILSRNLFLKPDHSWGKERAQFLVNLIDADPCDHLNLENLTDAPFIEKISSVNRLVNQTPYVTDKSHYGYEDIWATPHDFFTQGGDCEDYAIAKFSTLASLNIPRDRLFILALSNRSNAQAHASLGVQTDQGMVILDNTADQLNLEADYQREYKLTYALNVNGLWIPA